MSVTRNIRKWCGRCVEAMAGLALWIAVPASGMEAATIGNEAQGAGGPNAAWNEPGCPLALGMDLSALELTAHDDPPMPLPVE